MTTRVEQHGFVRAESETPTRRRAAKRVAWAVASLAAMAGVGLVAAATSGFGFAPASADQKPAAASTDVVTRQDLVATIQKPGDITNAEQRTLKGAAGIVTWLPVPDAVIERGGQLYRIDEIPVVLLYGTLPAYRTLQTGVTGADVQQLETNLAALGYTGFDVDTSYTAATATAVKKWQKDLGVTQTGVVEPSAIHVASDAVVVTDVAAKVGDEAAGNLLSIASRQRIVTVELDQKDAQYAVVGAAVTVTLADGTSVPAKITAVETVVTKGSQNPDGSTSPDTITLDATITPDDAASIPANATSSARVAFTADHHDGVLTVPVGALLALSEGGYGVEVVSGSTRTLTAVTTGMFANGRVEVSGTGIAEGTKVEVAS